MKEIPLANGRGVALVDDDDYAALTANRWHCTNGGYAARGGGSRPYVLMHRQLLGFPVNLHVDHINGVKLDNTRANIRACTRSQNLGNRKVKRGGLYKGVWRHGGCNRWQAELRIKGRRLHLGLHKTPEDAARAYDAAAREHFGEFARLNFPGINEQAA